MTHSTHVTLPRRRFIELLGGGVVLAAVPLAAGCGPAMPAHAIAAWADVVPQADADPRRYMLAHALLAPNPHNRQPWIADLRRGGEIAFVCDEQRLLPDTDPFGRQILIGCGAFIELAVIAAAERGIRAEVQLFPSGEPAPDAMPGGTVVARLVLQPDANIQRDPLFAQIRRRHTHRGNYDSARALSAAHWQALTSEVSTQGLLAGAVVEPAMRAQIRDITRTAYEAEVTTPRTYLESARLMRIGPREIGQHRDGISLTGTMPRVASALGLFDRHEVPKRGSANFERVMQHWQASETGSGYLWIASRGNARRVQLAAGRAYVRAHLQATAAGIDMHPLSQALQEFAEVRPQYEALHRLLGFEPGTSTLQMLARVGYGTQSVGPSPRRDLAQLLRTA